MDKTTAMLLKEVCDLKGINLTTQLKEDADKVLSILTDDVVCSGIKTKVEYAQARLSDKIYDMEKRIKKVEAILQKFDQMEESLNTAQGKMSALQGKATQIMNSYNEAVERQKEQVLINKKLLDARIMYASMLRDAVQILGKENATSIGQSIYQAASYSVWRQSPQENDTTGRKIAGVVR